MTARELMKSPIVRISLNSQEIKVSNAEDSTDEHIANLPDMINDSMVGDINQLISDLNKGQLPRRQLSDSRQLEDVVD